MENLLKVLKVPLMYAITKPNRLVVILTLEVYLMKKLIYVVAVSTILISSIALAGQKEFCAGFAEGYKAVKGDLVVVPVCPVAPVTPVGSTDYREGLKAGMAAARR